MTAPRITTEKLARMCQKEFLALREHLGEHDGRFTAAHAQIETLAIATQSEFTNVYRRFDTLETKIDQLAEAVHAHLRACVHS